MNKGLLGKVSLFSVMFLAIALILIFVLPVFSAVIPTPLNSTYSPQPPATAWVNLSRGDMFFTNGDQVFVLVNYSCSPPSVCNQNMTVTGNFSSIGGSGNRAGLFKFNGTNAAWAVFEINDTVDFTSLSGIMMTPKNITFNATDGNLSTNLFNDTAWATVVLVNMSYPPGCPPADSGVQLPPAVPLLNKTIVNVINDCWTNCTVDDHAQQIANGSYVLCSPTFGGSTTNFTELASTGNFSNFSLVIDIPGNAKLNFTQNVSMDTPQKAQALFQFAIKNMMAGGRIGINETEWNGTDTTKPNLNLSARLTIYNFSARFGLPSGRRPSIARRAVYETGNFSPCPPSICSGVSWDGQNLTFDVTGFSEYSVEAGLSMILSNTTGQNFNSTTNISYTNTRNINFSYIPTWNSTVNPQAVRLWGNFTGTWAANVTNSTALTNATPNYINNTVGADGAYLWNAVINDTTGGNDTHVANWTIIVDTTGPTWFTNQSSTTNYSSTLSRFNITWNDSTSLISTVFITIRNSTNDAIVNNASMTNTFDGSIYNYSIVLPAGTFNWTSYANDSLNNWNASDTWVVTIGKGTVPLVLSNNVSWSGTYPYSTNITGSGCPSQVTCTLYRNDTNLGSGSPKSDLALLGAGAYVYVYNASATQNYSANSTSIILTITKGTPTLTLTNSSTTYPSVTTINGTVATGDTVGSYNISLYRNGTLVNSTTFTSFTFENVTLGAGIWNYTLVYNGSANYNSANITNYTNVSKGTPDVKTFINDNPSNTTINYSSTLTIKGNSSSGGVLPALFNISITNVTTTSQSVSISNTSQSSPIFLSPSIGNGTYRINLTYDGNSNWSSAYNDTIFLFVNKGDPTSAMNISINGTANDSTVSYPYPTNVTSWSTITGQSSLNFTLYRNNANISNVNNTPYTIDDENFFGNGTYTYILNTSGNANYTSGNVTRILTISPGTPTPSLTISPSWTVTYPTPTTVICAVPSLNSEVPTAFLFRDGNNITNTTENGGAATLAAGTYNYTCNSSATANYSASSTSNILTVNAASSSTPTGGSSLGGITSTGMVSYITLAVGKANITVNYLTTSGKLIANIARYQDVAFRGMNVTVVNNVLNIKIMISKLSSLPSSVSYDINGKVYNYISVDEQNFTDADIKTVNINFAVNKTWLTNNNVDASNITLYRWANNKWNDLNAVKVSDDGKEVFFTASSPGLSIFVIGTKGGAPVVVTPNQPAACTESWTCTDWSACANDQQSRTCTDANNCGTTSNKPGESQSCTVSEGETTVTAPVQTSILTTIIVIVVAIIACVFIFLQRDNISSRLKKFDKKYNNNKNTSYLVEDEEEEKFTDV